MAEKKKRSYGGAAVAAGGAGLATSMPLAGHVDRKLVPVRQAAMDRKIRRAEKAIPKRSPRGGTSTKQRGWGASPTKPGKRLDTKSEYHPKSPAQREQLRLDRKAGYRKVHELKMARKAIKPGLSIRSLRGNIAAAGVGVPLSYAGARHQLKTNKLSKKMDSDEKKLAAGYAGATLGAAGYQGAGYAAIPLERKAAKKIKANPVHQARHAAHRVKHIKPTTNKNDPQYRKYFRKYPKSLPGGKMRRTLSWTHTGKTGTAATLAAAAVGGGVGVAAASKKKVKKSDTMSAFGVDHG